MTKDKDASSIFTVLSLRSVNSSVKCECEHDVNDEEIDDLSAPTKRESAVTGIFSFYEI